MDFYSVIELEHIKAIQAALEPTLDSIWRLKCRAYSQKFFTPLHVVMYELDPVMVLQALYEDQYHPSSIGEEMDSLLERLYTIRDPNYQAMSNEDIEDFVDAVLNKEIARLAKTKKVPETKITSQKAKTETPETITLPGKPKSGGMKFNDLAATEEKAEAGKAGFED